MVQGKQENKAVWLKFRSPSLNGDCAAYVNQIFGLKEAWRALKGAKWMSLHHSHSSAG